MKARPEERYLGGFSSPSMRKGMAKGYGIYATDRRFFGVYDRLAGPGPLVPSRPPGHGLMRLLATKGSTALIRELERRSDLKIAREEISMVEIRKPSWLRRGHVILRDRSGKRAKIWILENRDFTRATDVFRKFCPEALRIELGDSQ